MTDPIPLWYALLLALIAFGCGVSAERYGSPFVLEKLERAQQRAIRERMRVASKRLVASAPGSEDQRDANREYVALCRQLWDSQRKQDRWRKRMGRDPWQDDPILRAHREAHEGEGAV